MLQNSLEKNILTYSSKYDLEQAVRAHSTVGCDQENQMPDSVRFLALLAHETEAVLSSLLKKALPLF